MSLPAMLMGIMIGTGQIISQTTTSVCADKTTTETVTYHQAKAQPQAHQKKDDWCAPLNSWCGSGILMGSVHLYHSGR